MTWKATLWGTYTNLSGRDYKQQNRRG